MVTYYAVLFILEIIAASVFMCIGMMSCRSDEKETKTYAEPIPFRKAA